MKKTYILKNIGKGVLTNINPDDLVCIGSTDLFGTDAVAPDTPIDLIEEPIIDINFDVTGDWLGKTLNDGGFLDVVDIETFRTWLINGIENYGFPLTPFEITYFNLNNNRLTAKINTI